MQYTNTATLDINISTKSHFQTNSFILCPIFVSVLFCKLSKLNNMYPSKTFKLPSLTNL